MMRVRQIFLAPGPGIPNNPRLPVLVYRAALGRQDRNKADRFEALFAAHGWGGSWRDGIYRFHHFHSNAHEALGIARGQVTLLLGGPGGRRLTLKAGDAAVLPAGTGHCRAAASPGLLVVGAYPKGQERYDICRSMAERPDAAARIAATALPAADPCTGAGGPLGVFWKKGAAFSAPGGKTPARRRKPG
jgi:uncharacterized protein YjlB